MKKNLAYIFAVIVMCVMVMLPTEIAYAANVSLSASASSVNIGDSVKVTVTIPENVSGSLNVLYPADILEYSSASTQVNATTKGTVIVSLGTYGEAKSNKVTITFKAKTAGEATVKTTGRDDYFDNETYDAINLSDASTKITVKNESQEAELSSDYFLAKLNITAGSKKVTLSPTFNYRKTSYTATVDYEVTDVVVSVTRSSGTAEIVSITDNGKVKLNVGSNKIEIVVKAENGKTLTYTVTITRKEKAQEPPVDPPATQEPPTPTTPDFEYGGAAYYVVETPDDKIPTDFVEKTVILSGGKEVAGLSFEKADLTVLYMENDAKIGNFFVYNEKEKAIYPLVKLSAGENYVIALMAADEDVPENYNPCTLSVEGKGVVNAYQIKDSEAVNMSDFYLMYCVNNKGTLGWYQYDLAEGTYQRYAGMIPVDNTQNDTEGTEEGENTEVVAPGDKDLQDSYNQLEKELQAAKDTQRIIICVAIFVGAILAIIILNLLLAKHHENDGYEDDDEDDYEEEPEVTKTADEKAEDDEVEFIDL